MEIDRGTAIDADAERHQAVMQWALRDSGPLDGSVHIQVGTLAGGWYVRHKGFGARRFPEKRAAWHAVRALMDKHDGRWEQVAVDSGPFRTVCRPDGSRILYDMNDDESLHACWGRQKDKIWEKYRAAIDAGETVRITETHSLFGGSIELVRYRDPEHGIERYAVITANDPGSDYRVVDHPDRRPADREYEAAVNASADEEFPFKSSDILDVPVDRKSKPPSDLTVLPTGEIIATDDLEEYYDLYGGPPPRMQWPTTPDLAVPPHAVSGMTAEPRDWDPVEVTVQDVTPAAWREGGGEPPNHLALAALPDGRQLLATADDAAAHVWSAGDGTQIRTISGHSEWVLSVALAVLSDGQVMLATGGKDGLARIWSARGGDPLQELTGHRRPVNTVAWARPPGKVPWLVTGGDDATVRIWDVETGRATAVLPVGAPSIDIVWSVATAVLSDGHVCLAAAADDADRSTVYVWDATTGTKIHEYVIERDQAGIAVPSVAVATLADRSYRIAAAAGSMVRVWDGHSGQVVRTLPMDGARDVALAVAPDLRAVVAATGGRQTLVWDVESGAPLTTVDHAVDGTAKPVDLVARPDGGLLLATGREGDTPARLLRLNPRW